MKDGSNYIVVSYEINKQLMRGILTMININTYTI